MGEHLQGKQRGNNRGNLDYQRDEQQVHRIVYHLIWCPKRRSKVLVNQLGTRCEEVIRQKCDEKGWTILDLGVQPDTSSCLCASGRR